MKTTDDRPDYLVPRGLYELGDHVEMEHERELGGLTEKGGALARRVRSVHAEMHRSGDHWNHTHPGLPHGC